MNYLVPLYVVHAVVTCASGLEPLAVMVQRRRSAYPVYASDFMQEYEPYAVAAWPLHAPLRLPLLQVLQPAASKRAKRPQGVRGGELHAYASDVQYSYEQDAPPGTHAYEYEEEAPVVVYARPNPSGGYTYRKPSRAAPAAAPSSHNTHHTKEPIIIRIHKYRVIH